ncbi:hypothetical protein NBRC10513v2_002515 [Rhodotorula toruloides]|uniref:Uncharacterized protein n=1 Tax=Rhodotorula toruloides TaxID=5286 RepID=A0A0K3CIR9_RHOTO|nr:hypothetical protein AAT19DRAFT_15796 [Rhodotorula toruloides]
MDWDEISPKFLPVPWAPFTSSEGNLLLKLVYLAKEGVLAVMATDLENVYFETLNRRQTNKRLGDALRANADSQSDVALGIGEEGERVLQESVEALLSAVSSGTAKAEISHEAFEHFIKVSVPDRFTVEFLTISLENRSASILAAHLVTPLLGVCSSLLALLRDASTDDEALLKRIESAVDSSGKAERMDEGRSMTRFMGLGGPALLGRWTQRSLGAKEKDLQPVTLSLPNRPQVPQRPFSPALNSSAPKRKRSPSPRLPSPPPQQFEPRESVSPVKPVASLAHRMLDHAGAKGERIGWDDSQTQRPVATPENDASETKMDVEPVAAADQSVEEEEPATDEDEPLPASSPLRTSVDRSPSQRPPRHLPHASTSGRRDLSPTPTATQKSMAETSPPPTAEADAEAAEKERKKEAAKRAKAAEEEQEKARRRARLQKAAAGPTQPKKKAKRL